MLTKIRKAIDDFSMIENGDRICVGISGGKDSLVLLTALARFRKYAPYDFEVVAVHLNLGFPDMDFGSLTAFLKQENIEYQEKPTEVYEILKKNLNGDGSLKCSLCSKFKKALVIDAAKEHNCRKVAFGHHSEDAIETLWLNAIYGGKLATFRPKMYLSRSEMTFIRPLIYVREREIMAFAENEKLPVVKSTCPNDGYTKRTEMKNLLNSIYEQYPTAYENFLTMLGNSEQVDLWDTDDQ